MEGVTWVIAVAVLAVMAAVLVTFVYRVARFSNETRHLVEFRTGVAAIGERSDRALGVAAEAVDAVRRGSASALDIVGELGEALTAAEDLAARAHALGTPDGAETIRQGLIDELERAGRALEMIQHGCSLLASAGGRDHVPEAQTAIKRGYLNLLHARESAARHVAAAAALQVTVPRFLARRPAE